MGIRKNAARLTPTERDDFLRAVMIMKNTIANPAAPVNQRISVYDQFVGLHLAVLSVNSPTATSVNTGHQGAGFGPWHREYLRRFELALQAAVPGVNLPYWDWSDHTGTQLVLFQDNFMGPNGGAGGVGGGNVQSGYFAFDAPGTGTNPTPLPAWWPAGLAGWRVRSSLSSVWGTTLQRYTQPFANLATTAHVLTTLATPTMGGLTPDAQYNAFRSQLEAGTRMHNYHHGWVGGDMGDPNASPNDLIFFLHHCNIDRLWAMWQINGHAGSSYYPATGQPHGHNLNDPMWPWVGALPGYSSNNIPPDVVLPDFTGEPVRRPVDALDHRAMGFRYDTEVVLGIALDQTGSMSGMTPDPMVVAAPDVTKWEAAKRGVAAALHDCESAFAAGEAYVVAGVETFRSLGVINTFTPVFPGTPYGLVQPSGAYSELQFNASIAGQTPGGGTPLAGALSDTEATLVRPPFGNLPANDERVLFMLTDGMETAAPPLSSLGSPAFPDTVVFAMGFGVGSGWNGVDYTTIVSLVSKGKPAPVGVAQTYHGESAGTIDKFFTNSIAATIGYVPSVDPIYEVFPGEHIDTPFQATSADESFMITAQGFDFSDDNWRFCLLTPSGEECACEGDCDSVGAGGHAHGHGGGADEISGVLAGGIYRHVHGGVLVTTHKKNGRITIFLQRNGAEGDDWVGRWNLRAMYRMPPSSPPIMFMPSLFEMLLPVGAPPTRGPVYARLLQSPARRVPSRLLPRAAKQPFAGAQTGTSVVDAKGACTLAVNVYARTPLRATLATAAKVLVAGNDFDVEFAIAKVAGATVDQVTALGRLVAPRFSLGNAFADLKTIPLNARRRYVENNVFNEARFFADYEKKVPGAFAHRDELVSFERTRRGTFKARVSGNIYPGIYRLAVHVVGSVEVRGAEAEPFSRILQTEIAVGIAPDSKRSRPRFQLLGGSALLVRVTPTDGLGNIALALRAVAPVVRLNGVPVKSVPENLYNGEQCCKVELKGNGIRLSKDGKKIVEGSATVDTLNGKRLTLKAGGKLEIKIELNGQQLGAQMG